MNLFFFFFIQIILLNNILCFGNSKEFLEDETIQDSNDTGYDISKLYKFNCTNSNIDCSGNGICSEDGLKCICNEGYQTFYENFEDYLMNNPRCNYKSKYQLKALLFSIFISFGSAHFYLGHPFIGFLQFIFFLFIITFNSIYTAKLSIKHIQKLERDKLKISFNIIIIMIISLTLGAFWYIFDLLMIYLNIYKDSNNAKLASFYE